MGFVQSAMRSSRGRQWQPISLRLLFIVVSLLMFILVLALRSTTPTPTPTSAGEEIELQSGCRIASSSCAKLPLSVSEALVHYAASNITPQQTPGELKIAAGVLEKKSPCNFLVFGLGFDSLMWATLNHGGRTVFLEEDKVWIAHIAQKHPDLRAYHVYYPTMLTQAPDLLSHSHSQHCRPSQGIELETSACRLALTNLPPEVYNTQWDAIMIDAPRGYFPEAPGRMTAIYTAAVMARNRKNKGNTDIFVHDVDREVEENFSKTFLCRENLVASESRLWHFSVPAERGSEDFCSADRREIRGEKLEIASGGGL